MVNWRIILLVLIATINAQAQNLKAFNKLTQSDISNTSITIQAEDPKDWKGAESIDLYVVVENKSNKTIQVGAKKVEMQTLSAEIEHTFCFAGNCYNTATYISPFNVPLPSGKKDSSFLAHFLYDNTKHIRGEYKVKYVFFDTFNLSDSVFVEVTYNSKFKTAAIQNIPQNGVILSGNKLMLNDSEEHQVTAFTASGQVLYFSKAIESINLPEHHPGFLFIKIDDQVYRWYIE